MKVYLKFLIKLLVFTLFLILNGVALSQSTNRGTEFWVAYMDHIRGVNGSADKTSTMSLYITSDISTTGQISLADGSYSQAFIVTANQVTTLTIPKSAFLAVEGQALKGIHITSERPIIVYAHIYAQAVSGATLVLPVNTLSNDYYSINYSQRSNEAGSFSVFVVIATEDNTTVEITPSQQLNSGKPKGVPFSITLRKGELYQALAAADLTGSRIRSVSVDNEPCKKIAVFSGSTKIAIGCTETATADNLFQQAYPTDSWGKNFITVPLARRPFDIYRIIISDPATVVRRNGRVVNAKDFTDGFYYEFADDLPNTISADRPIQVVQYAVSQNQSLDCILNEADNLGDPEMIFLSPIEQNISDVTLYSAPYYLIREHYINVLIKSSAAAGFLLDGARPSGSFRPVLGNPDYSYGQFKVTAGTHHISAAEGFNAIAYGFGEFESYGYSAGTNIKNLNQYIELENVTNQQLATSGCIDNGFIARLVLPYQPGYLTWDFNNGAPPVKVDNPQSKSSFTKEGKTLYVYEYKDTIKYTSAGSYFVKLISFNPFSKDCGSLEETYFNFEVYDLPVAKFAVSPLSCLNDTLTVLDQSDAFGNIISLWKWDFGDGSMSNDQYPKHLYAKPGTYLITLTITSAAGCTAVFAQTTVVRASPIADFNFVTSDCEAKTLKFTDLSDPVSGSIKKWIWTFGDGATETRLNNTPFDHVYAQTGTYDVGLQVLSDQDCASFLVVKQVKVNAFPIIDFSLPEVCLTDMFAEFTDQSTIDDGSDADFGYRWDFGDPNATPANPNTANVKNPRHQYTRTGNYQVTLSITTKGACVALLSKNFTVNGSVPKANFEVLNASTLCSSKEVFFKNTSTVDFGNITKVVFYYDYGNAPTLAEADENPSPDKLYRHLYPVFQTPAAVTYTVRMLSFSGQTCVDEIIKVLTINATPVIAVSSPDKLCLEASPFKLLGSITDGFTGSNSFSGPGVTAFGTFDPARAGVGNHVIEYIFTSQSGCADTVTQTITVLPSPEIFAGPDTVMLEGGEITLRANAVTEGLQYKWTPSTGLNRDDILNPVAIPKDDITYRLTVFSADGCSSTDEVFVKVLKKPVIPNSFSPNGDAINDYWNIRYLDSYPNCTVEIYNRNGEKLYSSVGYGNPWDGRYNGKDLPVGTYYYIINPKNSLKMLAGSLTIIR
ncbi:MAG: PKD domain-containing protein [Sphingobacteriaceae bacterium]